MSLLKNSAIWRFVILLYTTARQSAVSSIADRFSLWIKRIWNQGLAGKILGRKGRLTRDFPESTTCLLLTWIISIVPRFLLRLRRLRPDFWEGSVIFRAVMYCAERSFVFLSWFIVILFATPQEYWNNMYSLIGAAFILFLFFLSAMHSKKTVLPEIKSIGVYPAAFASFTALFVLLSYSKSSSLRFFIFHFTCMLAVILIVNAISTKKELMRVLSFAVLGLFAASVCALVQRIQGVEVNPSYVDLTQNLHMPGRVYSFFENPNAFAFVLTMFLPLPLVLALFAKGSGKWFFVSKLFYAAAFLAAAAALMLTYTRGAWVGFAFSIFVLTLILKPMLVPVFALAGIFMLPLLPDTMYNRVMSIFNTKDTSIASRSYLYDAAWRLIAKNPFAGVGLGTDIVKRYLEDTQLYNYKTPFIHTHSIYLQITCEMGAFALFAFLGTICSGVKRGFCVITGKKGSKDLRAIIAALISCLAGTLLYALTDYTWFYPRVMLLFWIMFAFLLSAIKIANNER